MLTKIQIDMRSKWGGADNQDVSYMIAGDNCIEVYQHNKKNETMHHLVATIPHDSPRYEYYVMKLDILRPYKIYLTILNDEQVVVHRSYTLEDIEEEAKFDEEMRKKHLDYDIDDNDASMPISKFELYTYFMNEIMCTAFTNLEKVSRKNHKLRIIKGEECPVLKVPLDKTARKFMKCGHFISSEAFMKMLTHSTIKCPQCRTEHDCSECTENW
jgi:hypothetical protein